MQKFCLKSKKKNQLIIINLFFRKKNSKEQTNKIYQSSVRDNCIETKLSFFSVIWVCFSFLRNLIFFFF